MAAPPTRPHQMRAWLMALAVVAAVLRGRRRRVSERGAVAYAAAAAAAVLRHAADVVALGLGLGEATAAFQRARAMEWMRKSTAVVW
jgi:MYXO-CTERM domain-containing protein